MARTNLTFNQTAVLADFDASVRTAIQSKFDEHDQALDLIGAPVGSSGAALRESISAAGALSPNVPLTDLTVSGTVAYTLADAATTTQAGFRKRIRCISAASTPAGTLTIASPDATAGFVCSSTFLFDTVGQEIELEWTGTKWRAVRVVRAGSSGVDGVVVGTTVLTGKNLWAAYYLSVTGTVASTTTKAIPDGSAPGEIIQVGCSTAASIPSGTIACTGVTTLGASGTKALGTFNATTVWAALRWNGSAWQQVGGVTAVLS